jgi:hypothetical protein
VASRAEQIAQAVAAALSTPAMSSVPAARVFRDMRGALDSGLLPAVAIETGNEPPPARTTVRHLMRTVEIRVTVLGAGGGYSVADPAHVESSNRLFADVTLGGLAFDLTEGPVVREREEGDRPRVAVTHTYLYQYRTTDGSIE